MATKTIDYDGCVKSITTLRDKVVARGKKLAESAKARIERLRNAKVTVQY
jgi:hypothetical protein